MGLFRPVAAIALALLPCACGFHPLYGPSSVGKHGEPEESQLAGIRVDTIADRQGQKLRNFLIDDLQGEGVPPPAVHQLSITYNETQTDLGLNNDATTTRGQLTLSANFVLKDIRTGTVELTGTGQQITAYNIQNSEFATILSRDDAEDRALKSVADNLQLRLALFFRNVAQGKPTTGAAPPKAANPGLQPGPDTSTVPGQQPLGGQVNPLTGHAPGQVLDNQTPITQTP